MSFLDSSVVPLALPGSTDLLLLFLTAQKGNPFLLAGCAIVGSVLGAYLTWKTGQKGGEAALQKRVPKRRLERISRWVENHSSLSVFLPAILPPPVPLMPLILAAGALGVSRKRFLLVFSAGRTLRYAFVAWLGVTYGHYVVRMWTRYLAKWSTPIMWAILALTIGGLAYGIYKWRQGGKQEQGTNRRQEPVTTGD